MRRLEYVLGVSATLAQLAGCVACDSFASDEPSLSRSTPARTEEPRAIGPVVELSGKTTAAIAPPTALPRLYGRALRAWVYAEPSERGQKLGYLRAGTSVLTRTGAVGTAGCAGGWFGVEPEGFVCNGATATLDRTDPIVQAFIAHPPDPSRKLPYIYGTVRKPGPVYGRLPSFEEVRAAEPGIDERMQAWFDLEGEEGADYAQHVWLGGRGAPRDPQEAWDEELSEGVPDFLKDSAPVPNLHRKPREKGQLVLRRMQRRLGYALLETFLSNGRRYGLTTELELVPTDRLRPIQGSDFHGFRPGVDLDFPVAIVRQPKARYRDGSRAEYRSLVRLTGQQLFLDGTLHYESVDGKWISDRAASRLEPTSKPPGWAKNGEKWIDINLTKQTLMLYEGEKPVYVTLISSGEAGLADPKASSATERGIFRIHTKHISATMASNEVGEAFELRDVPYVQYFHTQGYAIHGAYWHDRFGIPKSHGCINLAPEDARRVFFWTQPEVPPGWHGKLQALTGTVVFIHS